MPRRHKKITTLSIDPELLQRTDRIAQELNVNRSQLICDCIRDALDTLEQQAVLINDPNVMRAFSEAFTRPGVLASFTEALKVDLDEEEHQQLFEFLASQNKRKFKPKTDIPYKGGRKKKAATKKRTTKKRTTNKRSTG